MVRRRGWCRPPSGVLKLNVDVAYSADTGTGATGAIIRDSGGNFVAASCEYNEHAIDASTMEAMALLAVLQLAEAIGVRSIMVESDSMEVVEAVTYPFDYRGTGVVIIDDCRELLMTLGMATLKHCPREANGAAHELARRSAQQGTAETWFDISPIFITSMLVNDMIIIQ
jgi:ribonuclease HI